MKKPFVACVLAAVMVASSPASAALNAYLSLTGAKTGKVRGSVTQKGREGKIAVIATDHRVQNPSGKRQHGVFTITKEVDQSSPLLYKALATNDTLPEFEVQYWTPNLAPNAGPVTEVVYYTVKLGGARISEIKLKMLNNRNPENLKMPQMEEVSFSYESITWTFTDGGITATDKGVSN